MTLIRKPHEIEVQQTLKCLIYGQAGTGKTTLALSSPKPLLLDFDGGVNRLNNSHRADTVQIKNWGECLQVMKEDLSAYQTIVVDTIGKMLDFIIEDVCKGRVPQIKDWGPINNHFTSFCRQLNGLNKNIIFVAHRDNRKEGDKNVFVPAIREKSYNSIVTELDLMGYLESREDKRVITFDFSDRNDGKNTCNLPRFIDIPTVVDAQGNALPNTFLAVSVIAPHLAKLKAGEELQRKYMGVIQEIKEELSLVTDEVSLNDLIARIDAFDHVGSSKATAKVLISARARELGLTYNKEAGKYEKHEPAA